MSPGVNTHAAPVLETHHRKPRSSERQGTRSFSIFLQHTSKEAPWRLPRATLPNYFNSHHISTIQTRRHNALLMEIRETSWKCSWSPAASHRRKYNDMIIVDIIWYLYCIISCGNVSSFLYTLYQVTTLVTNAASMLITIGSIFTIVCFILLGNMKCEVRRSSTIQHKDVYIGRNGYVTFHCKHTLNWRLNLTH